MYHIIGCKIISSFFRNWKFLFSFAILSLKKTCITFDIMCREVIRMSAFCYTTHIFFISQSQIIFVWSYLFVSQITHGLHCLKNEAFFERGFRLMPSTPCITSILTKSPRRIRVKVYKKNCSAKLSKFHMNISVAKGTVPYFINRYVYIYGKCLHLNH